MPESIEGLVIGEVHPPAGLHAGSPIITVQCDACGRTWPCHLGAWGYGEDVSSRCAACHEGWVRRIT